MVAIWTEPALSILLFLGAGGAVLGLIRMLRPATTSCMWATGALLGLAITGAGFGGVALVAGRSAGIWLPALALFGLCTLTLLGSWGVLNPLWALGSRVLHSSGLQVVALLTGCPALAIWWALAGPASHPRLPGLNDIQQDPVDPQRQIEEVSSARLQTDAGRPVKVAHSIALPISPAAQRARQVEMVSGWGLNNRVIALPITSEDCNCHGMVFTGGAYWLHSRELGPILEDNGYHQVTDPQPGDVALYRDQQGQIAHSGLVHSVGRDGLILVESKWGELGRFLHPVDEHPYPDCVCTYLRTERGSHLLQGLPRPERVAATTPPASTKAEMAE
jgi:hypothetical protein